jgi:uncharacterized membrane protein YeiH
LSDPSCRLVTLAGPGGIGKTRLAIQVAEDFVGDAVGVTFVPLAGLRSATLLVPAIADALGLAFFTISGAQIAEQSGLSWLLAILMGAITGVAGGMARDVLCNEIPLILRRGQLYASSAIVGAALYLVLERAGTPREAASLLGMATIALVRFAGILWRIELPVLSLEEEAAERRRESV